MSGTDVLVPPTDDPSVPLCRVVDGPLAGEAFRASVGAMVAVPMPDGPRAVRWYRYAAHASQPSGEIVLRWTGSNSDRKYPTAEAYATAMIGGAEAVGPDRQCRGGPYDGRFRQCAIEVGGGGEVAFPVAVDNDGVRELHWHRYRVEGHHLVHVGHRTRVETFQRESERDAAIEAGVRRRFTIAIEGYV